MNKAERVKELERELAALLKESTETVKPGDYIILMCNYEWVGNKGTRMWVAEVHDSHILARSERPESRHYGIFWISNGDYVKEN